MISWHPLDGLYLYAKKFWFIEQYKKNTDPGPFSAAVMVKKITRAKKKWFFIMVEDITDSFEFFVKELLDIKVYDILIISWYKARNRGIETMIKISIEQFIEQAEKSGKYNPEWTVAKVRSWRKWNIIKEYPKEETSVNDYNEDIVNDNEDIVNDNDNIENNNDNIENNNNLEEEHKTQKPITIQLPDSLAKIQFLIQLLQNHAWEDHTVIVNNTTYHINDQWMTLINQHYL